MVCIRHFLAQILYVFLQHLYLPFLRLNDFLSFCQFLHQLLNSALLVDFRLVFDLLGSGPEPQGADGLFFIEGRGGASDDETGLGVTSKGFLEDTGQFGVSVRDMGGDTVC